VQEKSYETRGTQSKTAQPTQASVGTGISGQGTLPPLRRFAASCRVVANTEESARCDGG